LLEQTNPYSQTSAVMAKGANKSKVKQVSKADDAPVKSKSSPPSPYTTPPPSLRPFLETLNPKHIYITHIDTHPKNLKFRVFLMTAALNLAIAFGLIWRVLIIMPWYSQVLMAMWGYENERAIDIPRFGLFGVMNETTHRAFTFLVDFILIKVFVPWPLDFFVGYGSPTTWRLGTGFQEKEIGVRRSRKWDQDLPKNWLSESSDGVIYKERVMPAIDRQWISTKTSYLMQDKSWDLDFAAMTIAQQFVKNGTNKLEDFQKTVIVYSEDHGWIVWQVWKLDEGSQDEGRRKILELKEKLIALDKEDLFYRWIEVIQYETSQEGGFTEERQAKAMKAARDLFKSQGVDFDEIWKSIGGEV
jgi:hypothetical protein